MKKIKGYTSRSTSADGVYYLVNGWNKYRTFWVNENHIETATFKTLGQAKTSLTKLLKVMEDYRTDLFEYIAITENGEFSIIPHQSV